MNLAMDVLRLITVNALKGRTWAGMRVFDSPASFADLRIEEERAPFYAVYTDDADFGTDQTTIDSFALSQPSAVWLIIEGGVASPVTIDVDTGVVVDADPSDADPDTPPRTTTVVTLNETSEAQEVTIGFLGQQAVNALSATDSPWADLWRTLCTLQRVEVRRGGNMPGTEGVRFASRILRIKVAVLTSPAQGVTLKPESFWRRFIDFAKTQGPDMAGLAAIIEAHTVLTAGRTLYPWRQAQKVLGITETAIRSIGPAPVTLDDGEPAEDEPHGLHRVTTVSPEGAHPADVTEADPLPETAPLPPFPDM